MEAKAKRLLELYRDFEEKTRLYREGAVCTLGCADCCTNVGDVDAVTLEGWIILEHMKGMDPERRSRLQASIEENARKKEDCVFLRCAFLQEDSSCAIYPVRPFSCRRLYSLVRCGQNGPTVHRWVWLMGEETVRSIQALDGNGRSGHLSRILMLLQEPGFSSVYLSGGEAAAGGTT